MYKRKFSSLPPPLLTLLSTFSPSHFPPFLSLPSFPLPSTYDTRPEGDGLGEELREEEEATHSPVGLPGVQDLVVLDAELCGLQVQEVKETLDGLWKGTASRDGKNGMKESIYIRLEGGRGRDYIDHCRCVGEGEKGLDTMAWRIKMCC